VEGYLVKEKVISSLLIKMKVKYTEYVCSYTVHDYRYDTFEKKSLMQGKIAYIYK